MKRKGGCQCEGNPLDSPGGSDAELEAGLLTVGDKGSTLATEQTRAGIQSDLVWDLAGESRKCMGVRGLEKETRGCFQGGLCW